MSAARPEVLSQEVLEQAARWFAELSSGQASLAQHKRWQAWLDASLQHAQAWRYVEQISQRFEPIKHSPERGAAIIAFGRARHSRRQLLRSLALVAGSAASGWGAWRLSPLPEVATAWLADVSTGTGETRQIALPDGTRVWLNAESAFDYLAGPRQRGLHLLRGEVLIETAADARPFRVQTPQGHLQPLGTRFSVRLLQAQTALAVFEGQVEVRNEAGVIRVPAGQQLWFGPERLGVLEPAEPARQAWPGGLLLARRMPLADVVQELRPYVRGHLGVASEITGLPVFGSFPLQDPPRALAMLEAALPLRIERPFPWWTHLAAR